MKVKFSLIYKLLVTCILKLYYIYERKWKNEKDK